MKKFSIAAICAASLASVCIAAPTFAAEAATLPIENGDLYTALKNSAHITTKRGEAVDYIDQGGSTPSGPAATSSLLYASPIISIQFDCTHGDPLAEITDFSDFDKFTELESIVLCSDIDYNFGDGIDLYIVDKHAPRGEYAISKKLAEAFSSADYTYYNLGNTASPIGTHAESDVIVGTSSENVKTITFDCSDGDPLAMFASNELKGPFSMFPNAETIYVCSDEFASVAPEGVEIINQNAVKVIPAGDYTIDYDNFMENGENAKLLTKDGKDTGYTLGDLMAFAESIHNDENSEYSIVEADDCEKILKNGKDYITFTFDYSRLEQDLLAAFFEFLGGTKAESNEEPAEAESTENPDTADDFTGIIAAVALSGVALGAGAFAATRRR